ncbi:maleylpyruvate isomerase family mycothiol-dependent enzyme [Umezawaea tangerina]|uniref:Uncharacterized protein (TIGR03083 family) n=1 Tax=Umezawaea tangerina TaxID=84725 RepID=A0A2T0SX11_9PSEU|nr:maleylpyruvate isomerase family mycothiol-dependent enzyme [Umezawaea tangerina]PRY37930.1 uncharacterized protein (TIGR03083 family) [Umezawaea tangerina]
MDFDRHRAEIVAQTELLTASIVDADLTTPVPSCPGWNAGQLLRHLGGGQRWAADVVRTRATEPPSDEFFRDLSPYAEEDPVVVGPWLTVGALALSEALAEAGPDAGMWTPVPGGSPLFWARRFAHETAVHRADAVLALGQEFELDPEVAVDTVDEWMELGSLPVMLDLKPTQRELLGPGRTIHLHATDVDDAEWVVDLTGEVIRWRRAHEKSAVAVRGPLVELLLVLYGRRSVDRGTVEVLGDGGLLDFFLERVTFG